MTNIYKTTEKGSLRFWDERMKNDIKKLSKYPGNPAEPDKWLITAGFDSSYSKNPDRCWFNIKERKNDVINYPNTTLFTDIFERDSGTESTENIKSEKVKL